MKLDTCNNSRKPWSLECDGVCQCFHTLWLLPAHGTGAGYSTTGLWSGCTSQRTP